MLKKIIIGISILLICSVAATASNKIAVGQKFNFPNFSIINSSKTISNAPTIIVFGAVWSKSCQKELSFLNKFDDKINIVLVSLDTKKSGVLSFINTYNVKYTVQQDIKLSSPGEYQILVIPTTFVVDKKGIIKKILIDFDDNVKKAIEKAIR